MKLHVQSLSAIVASIIIGSIGVVLALNHARAAGASIYFSPASRTVTQGATTTFTVRANTGGANADVAELAITYDTSKLEFAGVSAANSPINTPAGQGAAYKNSGSTISGSYFTLSPISGDIVLATITFKARVASGNTSVQLVSPGAGGTLIGGGGTDLGASLGSATVNFTAPPTNNPAPNNPGSGGSTGSSTPNKPTAPNNNSSGGNSSSGDPTTNTPTNTDPTASTGVQSEGEPILAASDVIPELKIGVFDKKNQPLRNKEVTLHSEPQSVQTDGDGFAVFKNVPIGDHTLSYDLNGTTHEMPVYVASADVQTVVFDFTQRNIMILWAILSTFVLAVAALVAVLIRRSGGAINFPRIRPRGPKPPTGPLGPNGATDFAPPKPHHWHSRSSAPGMVVGGPDGVKTFTEDK